MAWWIHISSCTSSCCCRPSPVCLLPVFRNLDATESSNSSHKFHRKVKWRNCTVQSTCLSSVFFPRLDGLSYLHTAKWPYADTRATDELEAQLRYVMNTVQT